MSQCSERYLPLCSIPARMSRDGWAGSTAKIFLPFHGLYFFSGEEYTFPGTTVPQDGSQFVGAPTKEGIFKKEGAWCGGQV